MKINRKILNRTFVVVGLTLWFAFIGLGQNATSSDGQGDWIRVSSLGDDISVALPSDSWIISAERGERQIFRHVSDSRVSISFVSRFGAKDLFALQMKAKTTGDIEYKNYKFDDFYIRQNFGSTKRKNKKDPYTSLYLVSSRGVYTITVFAKETNAELYRNVLASIELGGKRLYSQLTGYEGPVKTLSVKSLKTDDVVLEALKQPDSKQSKMIKYKKPGNDPDDEEENDPKDFSRGLIVLMKEKADYTESARRENITGIVTLKVTFQGNGSIGDIFLLESLDSGLDSSALRAARQIKFLPALVDGKPVDVIRKVVYSFNIY